MTEPSQKLSSRDAKLRDSHGREHANRLRNAADHEREAGEADARAVADPIVTQITPLEHVSSVSPPPTSERRRLRALRRPRPSERPHGERPSRRNAQSRRVSAAPSVS